MEQLGYRIRKLRNEKGVTQTDLGKVIGVGKSTISQYETGVSRPDYELLQKMADFFNVSVDYLLGRTDTRTPPHDPDEPTPQEIEDIIRKADLQFDGAPLNDEDKEDVIGFVRLALKTIKKRKREQGGQAPE